MPVLRSSRTKARCVVVVRADDSCSWPCARVGIKLPLASRMVGPSVVETKCFKAKRSVEVTKEPVAP